MAIARDATSDNSGVSGTSPSWNHTCTGSNLTLYVCVASEQNSTSGWAVTYNGTSMTMFSNTAISTSNGNRANAMFYLQNPSTGTHSIAVTGLSNVTHDILSGVSYTGTNQTGTPQSASATSGSVNGTTESTTINPTYSNSWMISMAGGDRGQSWTNATALSGLGTNGNSVADTNGTVSGSTTITTTQSGGAGVNIVTAVVVPLQVSANSNFLMFM